MTLEVRVARIGAPHGVRGELKLWSFTGDPAAVADYAPLETEDGKRHFDIETMRPAKDHFIVRIAGVADRDAAAKLVNIDLFVPRDRLPAIDEDDTWYHADLIGLAAVTPEGVALGTVTALHNFGAGDLMGDAPRRKAASAAAAIHRCDRAEDRYRREEHRRRAVRARGITDHVEYWRAIGADNIS